MSDLKVSPLIKSLSDNYVNNRISFDEYRTERQILLRQIDSEFNQRVFEDISSAADELSAEELQENNVIDETHIREENIDVETEDEEDHVV